MKAISAAEIAAGIQVPAGHPKLTEAQVREAHALNRVGMGPADISRRFDVSCKCIEDVLSGRTWKRIYAEVMAEAVTS